MLVVTSRSDTDSPEETALDLFLAAELAVDDQASPWVGHPLRLRTTMRDGTEVVFGFTLTECAAIVMRLRDDPSVRSWLELRRSAIVESSKLN